MKTINEAHEIVELDKKLNKIREAYKHFNTGMLGDNALGPVIGVKFKDGATYDIEAVIKNSDLLREINKSLKTTLEVSMEVVEAKIEGLLK